MKKLKTCAFLVFIAVVGFSCATPGPTINLYGPAMYGRDIQYQPKPMSSDSVHHATYASLSYYSGSPGNDKNGNDEIDAGQFNISQGYTFENLNLSYGAFGEIGGYQNMTNNDATKPNYFTTKNFGSLGGRFSANVFVKLDRVDFRIFGFEMAYSKEFGDYANYRNSLSGQQYYYINNRTELFTIGGTSEVIWHSRRNPVQFGLRMFIGKTLGDIAYRNLKDPSVFYPQTQTVSLAYFMQVKNYFFVGEVNPYGGILRAGIRF